MWLDTNAAHWFRMLRDLLKSKYKTLKSKHMNMSLEIGFYQIEPSHLA